MFEPEVEARFRRIEDAQIVAAELLHRFEQETRESARHLEAVVAAIARWLDRAEERLALGEKRLTLGEERLALGEEALKRSEERLAQGEERLKRSEERLERGEERHDESEAKLNALIDIVADLSRMMRDRNGKRGPNGGE